MSDVRDVYNGGAEGTSNVGTVPTGRVAVVLRRTNRQYVATILERCVVALESALHFVFPPTCRPHNWVHWVVLFSQSRRPHDGQLWWLSRTCGPAQSSGTENTDSNVR